MLGQIMTIDKPLSYTEVHDLSFSFSLCVALTSLLAVAQDFTLFSPYSLR